MAEGTTDPPFARGIASSMWRIFAQIWLLASIILFVLIRGLGSHTAQHLLSELKRRLVL